MEEELDDGRLDDGRHSWLSQTNAGEMESCAAGIGACVNISLDTRVFQ